jgi:capsular exopolysaccharide synthesis family protein
MVELKQYIYLLRKWLWLFLIGGLLGCAAGYLFSLYQPTIYETSTKILVSRAIDQDSQTYYFFNELQLAKTYAQLINTGLILQNLNQELGFEVGKDQISVRQVEDSLLLEITVRDSDPERAARIANTLVEVFINYNRDLQDKRFAESEQSLKDQIAEVQTNVAYYQGQIENLSQSSLEEQKQQVVKRIQEIEKQLSSSEEEIIQLENELADFFPSPLVTNTPAPYWFKPTPTPAPVPTPTLSPQEEVRYKELQLRLDQLKSLRDLYKDVYANLLVLDPNNGVYDPALTQQQLQTTLALYQQIYSNLLSSLANVQLAKARSAPSISAVEAATPPAVPIQPKPLRNVLLGLIAGVMITVLTAFTLELLDDTIKTPEEVNQHLRLPVIGLIGEIEAIKSKNGAQYSGVFVAENPLSPIAEAFRTLRANLDFASVDKPIKTLLITSVGPGEGKSTVAVNLAAIMAQRERKVILLDADLRRPTIHHYLGLSNRRGLTDLLREQTKAVNVISSWGNPPIDVILSGDLPPNPTELLESEKMTRILAELKDEADILIADSPPAIVADPIALSAKMDGVLLIVEPGKTKIGAAQVLLEQLHRAGARIIGVVLNPVSRKRSHYYTKYHYYTSYYYSRSYDRYRRASDFKERLPAADKGRRETESHIRHRTPKK